MNHNGKVFLKHVIPRCSYSRRSLQRQETAQMSSSLWQSAENKQILRQCYPPLTSLILTATRTPMRIPMMHSPQRSSSWLPA